MLLHIGYHKTGSTFLQKNLFGENPERFDLIGRRELYEALIYPDPLEYDESQAERFLRAFIAGSRQRGRIPVISSERLTGGLHTGGGDSREIARRLHSLLPDARILIVIREQRSMIYSAYAQFVKVRGSASLAEYLAPDARTKKSLFHLGYLEYHRLIGMYQELFGRDRVLVLPYELLRRDAAGFIERVVAFAYPDLVGRLQWREGTRNPALSPAALAVKRYLNPFMLRDQPFLGNTLYSRSGEFVGRAVLKFVTAVTPASVNRRVKENNLATIKEHTRNQYGASNRATEELTGLDLRQYGYDLNDGKST